MDEDTQRRPDPAEFFERVDFTTAEDIEAPPVLAKAPGDAREAFTPVDVSAALNDIPVQPLGERAPLPHEVQEDLVKAQKALQMISSHPGLGLGVTPAPLASLPTDDADIDYGTQRVGRLRLGQTSVDEVEYALGQFELGLIALGEMLDMDVAQQLGWDDYPEFVNRELQAENAAVAIMTMRYLVERNGELPRGARPSARIAGHESRAIYDAVETIATNPDGWRAELAEVVDMVRALDRHLEVTHAEHERGF